MNTNIKSRYARAAIMLNFRKLKNLSEEYEISGNPDPLDAEVEKIMNEYGNEFADEVRNLCYNFVNHYLSPGGEPNTPDWLNSSMYGVPTDADRLYKSMLDASEFADVQILLPNNVTIYKQKRGIFEVDANEYTATELYRAIGFTFDCFFGTRFKLSNIEILALLYAFY